MFLGYIISVFHEESAIINIIYIMDFGALPHLFPTPYKLLILITKLIQCHNNYVCHQYNYSGKLLLLLFIITVIVVAIIMLFLFVPLMT